MGHFLDTVITIAVKKNQDRIANNEKQIEARNRSYFERVKREIESRARDGYFYLDFYIRCEDSLTVAKSVSEELEKEGFTASIKSLMNSVKLVISWPPFEYKIEHEIERGIIKSRRFMKIKKFFHL